MAANRAVLEAISALAVRKVEGKPVRWDGVELDAGRSARGPPPARPPAGPPAELQRPHTPTHPPPPRHLERRPDHPHPAL